MFYSTDKIDKTYREFKDEGLYPAQKGTYHMYHRIDGKLVAVGVVDILKTFFNSAYFIYDPEYSFLNLGVVGAIRELEFMRMAKKKFNPDLKYYQLGDMVPNCSKVNYKLHYKPGLVLCPRTKNLVRYEDAKDAIIMYQQLPIEEKT